ncbi:hypothetical protein [Spiroplasma poulsonii]|uniref:hypothetical protein n=1 Tax=Spiroplasma poulsonii TaxID=2138 RepID=UPI001057318A|nr:hypothetical protein [Spiroplasma poulsonii]
MKSKWRWTRKLSIIGYVAYLKWLMVWKNLYMTKEQMENHFMKYSKTYAKNKSFYIASLMKCLKQY